MKCNRLSSRTRKVTN